MNDKQTLRICAVILSLLIPGLGQLIQKRFGVGIAFFLASVILWIFWLGVIVHAWAVLDAAFYVEPDGESKL